MSYWNDLSRHTDLDEIWMSHPLARAAINRRVSGDENVWPTTWLRSWLAERAPLGRALSIGCGVGNLERDLVGQGIAATVEGVDMSEACVAQARASAADAGLGAAISYTCGDARALLASRSGLDAIFFHGSLHHFERHAELMELVSRALRPEGILYLDEYAGPSRDEWRLRDLALPNAIYLALPRALRRARLVRAPINRNDPTEAVESSRIVGAVTGRFDVLARRDYGGNLLSIVYPNLFRPPAGSPGRAELDAAVAWMLDVEESILRHGAVLRAESFFTVMIARRR